MNIPSTLRLIRKNSGMTLQQLAEKTGSSAKTISQIETGKQEPTVALIKRLLEPLGYDLIITPK